MVIANLTCVNTFGHSKLKKKLSGDVVYIYIYIYIYKVFKKKRYTLYYIFYILKEKKTTAKSQWLWILCWINFQTALTCIKTHAMTGVEHSTDILTMEQFHWYWNNGAIWIMTFNELELLLLS